VRPSVSPIASPIVCVAKKSGDVRIACDCQYLNRFDRIHDELYELLHMPFGLKISGATFVRAVRSLLTSVCNFSESYVDDIGVGSDGWSQHLNHITRFWGIIKEVGMTLSIKNARLLSPR